MTGKDRETPGIQKIIKILAVKGDPFYCYYFDDFYIPIGSQSFPIISIGPRRRHLSFFMTNGIAKYYLLVKEKKILEIKKYKIETAPCFANKKREKKIKCNGRKKGKTKEIKNFRK